MAAPKGNRFWEARSSHGRNPIFKSPEQLFNACMEYIKWAEDNPLNEAKAFAYQGIVTVANVPKMRAMTVGGLCIFLDITRTTWYDYAKKNGFSDIVTRVEEMLREQKFTGAAAEMLNPNIIARDLGLKETTANEHSGTMVVAGTSVELTDEQLAKLIAGSD